MNKYHQEINECRRYDLEISLSQITENVWLQILDHHSGHAFSDQLKIDATQSI